MQLPPLLYIRYGRTDIWVDSVQGIPKELLMSSQPKFIGVRVPWNVNMSLDNRNRCAPMPLLPHNPCR
jgi:hypothetical protein